MKTYNQAKTFFQSIFKKNEVGAITGDLTGEAFVNYVLQSLPNATYDETRPYVIGQQCHYNNGNYDDVYLCIADTTGTFEPADWQRLTLRKATITQTIDDGETTINHTLEVVPHGILITDSSDSVVPFDLTEITDTYIKIQSVAEYINSKIYLIG
jgi:hypothetical protein